MSYDRRHELLSRRQLLVLTGGLAVGLFGCEPLSGQHASETEKSQVVKPSSEILTASIKDADHRSNLEMIIKYLDARTTLLSTNPQVRNLVYSLQELDDQSLRKHIKIDRGTSRGGTTTTDHKFVDINNLNRGSLVTMGHYVDTNTLNSERISIITFSIPLLAVGEVDTSSGGLGINPVNLKDGPVPPILHPGIPQEYLATVAGFIKDPYFHNPNGWKNYIFEPMSDMEKPVREFRKIRLDSEGRANVVIRIDENRVIKMDSIEYAKPE